MKKFLFLFLIIPLLLVTQAHSQPDLNIVWQKNLAPWGAVDFAKIAPDGSKIYIASYNKLWEIDAKNGDLDTIPYDQSADSIHGIIDMDISKLGNLIVTVNGDGAIDVWDVKQRKIIKKIQYAVVKAIISPDEKYIIFYSGRVPKNNLLLYDLQADSVTKRANFEGSIFKFKFSHDGKILAIGTQIYDQINNKAYDKLILWDAVNWKPIDTLETRIGSRGGGYRDIKFSLNDKYLGIMSPNEAKGYIYYLSTKTIIANTDKNLDCGMIELLPDNSTYLSSYSPPSSVIRINILDGKNLQNFNFYSQIIESTDTINGIFSIFLSDGNRMYLMKSSLTGIEPEIKSDIRIFYFEDKLNIEFTKFNYDKINIQIVDTIGKIIYTGILENLPQNGKTSLNLNLISGTYLCKVKYGDKEYVQKIMIVR